MSFSTAIFLYLFLPICMIGYWISDKKYKNLFLCILSFLFYAWSGLSFLILIIITTSITYILGIKIEKSSDKKRKIILVSGIIYCVGILFYFKYFTWFANSIVVAIQHFVPSFEMKITAVSLPLGISFYTFSILSYLIDIYWEKSRAQKKISNLFLYILLFPKVMTGPIMRYSDFEQQIGNRSSNLGLIYTGIERFIKGLVKKILIADRIAPIVTYAFSDVDNLNTLSAWLGIFGYLLQLYFDFSGYSDMAIGLGNMLGFRMPENFDHPYMSKSVAEYWRRWHITLGEWLKDYIYMPVFRHFMLKKSSVKKISMSKMDIIALFVTWLIAGIWHGAGINFILYGLWYFMFISIERLLDVRKKKLIKANKITKREDSLAENLLKRFVTIFAIIIGQVMFRSGSFQDLILYIKSLFSMNFNGYEATLLQLTNSVVVTMIIGVIFCFPIYDAIKMKVKSLLVNKPVAILVVKNIYNLCLLIAYFIVLLYIAGADYAPFLYEVF